MYITDQQQSILALLKEFNCLRRDQIVKMIIAKYKLKNRPVKSVHQMLKQLDMFGKIQVNGDFILIPQFKDNAVETDSITAFDIMLDITKGNVLDIRKGTEVVQVQFNPDVSDDNAHKNLFAIIVVNDIDESLIKTVHSLSGTGVIIIFLLNSEGQYSSLKNVPNCHFALRDGHWRFKYFTSDNEQ